MAKGLIVDVSNCCGESIIENTDICSDCKEHCEAVDENEFYEEEYTHEDEAYDKASSNKGELI